MRVLGAVLALAAAVLAATWLLQRRLIYFPLGPAPGPVEDALPGAEEVELRTADGLSLAAWYLRSPAPRATVLVLPGNAGHRGYRAPLAQELVRRGFSVLLVDYRGYGGNPGRPSERGLYLDARAARDFLLGRSEVDRERIVYFGESLGAAVALELAVEHRPAALVLRSPFTSLAEVGRLHYPLLPVGLLLRDRYPSIERVGRLRCPLLVVAGERDSVVPAEDSRRLFSAAPPGLARWVLVPGVDHNHGELLVGESLLAGIEELWCATGFDRCEVSR
jgi:fermentation-respiration switch protein FrsA (DUF1100 family)